MSNIIPDTTVRFIKNVPFSNNYRNVIDFLNLESQTKFFLSLPYIEFDNLTYLRNNGALKVGKSRDEMLQYNYMMFQNKNFSNKWFYAFITNVSYLNGKSCIVSFELDIWQSWFFDMNLMPSYIERKHCRRWNTDGSPVINTIPESLDFGSEYQVKNAWYSMSQDLNNQVYWLVFVTVLPKFDIQNNMIGGVPNILNIFYYPISTNKRAISYDSTVEWGISVVNGVSLGVTPSQILEIFRQDSTLVNTLKTCYITDYIPIPYTVTASGVNGGVAINSEYLSVGELSTYNGQIAQLAYLRRGKQRYYDRRTTYTDKYYALRNVTESKLLMYPYSYVQLTDFQGNSFDIKNEYITGNDILIDTLGSVETTQKTAYVVNNYLNNDAILNKIDYGIINSEPNNITIIDDYSAAYLQGNANTIRQSISATHAQGALNSTLSQRQADVSTTNAIVKGNADIVSSSLQAVGGVVSGVANNGLRGGIGASATGLASMASSANQVVASRIITENNNQLNVLSTNMRGELNNQLAIKGALAKIQDTRNVADTANLQGGNTGFTIGNNIHGFALIAKQITAEYISILTDYFEKYGYAYHKVETPLLRTRQSWDYIQTTGMNIRGNIPQMYIESLEKIFDSGVTIWHTNDVGNYNLSNNEL